MMDTHRERFPKMFEATAGCIFFGSPFNGAQAASVAALFATVAEVFNIASTSKLLDFMKPGEAALRELRGHFMKLANTKLKTNLPLYCFYENHDTDVCKMATEFISKRMSAVLFDISRRARAPVKIVDRESATFGDTVENLGLASNHRDLVKFDDFKDPRYQTIRDPLKTIIHGARLVAKDRLAETRDVDMRTINSVIDALAGSSVSRAFIAQKFTPSDWLPKDKSFNEWLSQEDEVDGMPTKRRGDCLWITGKQGRGKTGATVAVLEEIDKIVKKQEEADSERGECNLNCNHSKWFQVSAF